jgi:hypothetical protein
MCDGFGGAFKFRPLDFGPSIKMMRYRLVLLVTVNGVFVVDSPRLLCGVYSRGLLGAKTTRGIIITRLVAFDRYLRR